MTNKQLLEILYSIPVSMDGPASSIAKDNNITEPTLYNNIKILVNMGWSIQVKGKSRDSALPTHYRIDKYQADILEAISDMDCPDLRDISPESVLFEMTRRRKWRQ